MRHRPYNAFDGIFFLDLVDKESKKYPNHKISVKSELYGKICGYIPENPIGEYIYLVDDDKYYGYEYRH